MSAVTIKTLVWEERVIGFWQAIDSTGGVYEVMRIRQNFARAQHVIASRSRNIGNGHKSPQDGRAAAQADFEVRIMSVIDVQPDPRDEVIAKLVEALKRYKSGARRVPFDLAVSSDAALAAAKAVIK